MDTTRPTPFFSEKTYDFLKYLAQIVLPAIGALYFGLAEIWALPYGAEIVGTITVVDTFLGIILKIDTSRYNQSEAKYDGSIDIFDGGETKTYALNLKDDPETLDTKQDVLFEVNKLNSSE